MDQQILVPLDGSPLAERALPLARVLAKAGQAQLILLRVISPPTGHDPGDADGSVEAVTTYLRDQAARLTDVRGVETAVAVGDAADAILDQAERRPADLVVMSTHGRSGIGRWVYGSVADAVMRRSPVPVFLVPADCPTTWPHDRAPRILVPLDGSELAERALDPAVELAKLTGAELLLVRVVEPHPMEYGVASGAVVMDPTPELERAHAYLADISARLRPRELTVRATETFGFAVSAISDAARGQGADAIVLSTHGAGGLSRLLMGSVATGLVQRAHVPLLIVRPGDAGST